jgi:hypothetical protein
MHSCTKSASRVRHTSRVMNVRDLHRCRKNQQQSTAKSKPELPPAPPAIFGLLIVHYSNYNLTPTLERARPARVVKTNHIAQYSRC